MSREAFFAHLRRRDSGLFGTKLTEAQVQGTEALLDSLQRNVVSDPRHCANVLAQVYHETGRHMLGIKETVYPSHKNKNPSDATVIKRLDRAWEKGQLGNVKKPYWRDGWFGRGPIQITHEANYRKIGGAIGVDLVSCPGEALDPVVGADIAVVGMRDGLFRGRKLADYFNDRKNDPSGARNIVNGDVRKNGPRIRDYHDAFLVAIEAAGGIDALMLPETADLGPPPSLPPSPKAGAVRRFINMLLAMIERD